MFDSSVDPLSSPMLQRHRSVQDLRLDASHADPWGTARLRTNGRLSVDEQDLRTQISELKVVLERQGDMLRRIMESMEGRKKHRVRDHAMDQGNQSTSMS